MSGAIRDVLRATDDSAGLEFTLADGQVLHARGYGVHADEEQRTATAILAALAASGIKVLVA